MIYHRNEAEYRAWKAEVEAETRRLRFFGAVLVATLLAAFLFRHWPFR